jgi:nitrite reductase (NADH) small subunit
VARHAVCRVEELPPGGRRVVTAGGRAIAVLNVDGRLYAIRDACPHQGAALSTGTLGGTFVPSGPHEYVYGLEGRVLRCPWHGFEFDLETGCSLFDPEGVRVRVYPVAVEDGVVLVEA